LIEEKTKPDLQNAAVMQPRRSEDTLRQRIQRTFLLKILVIGFLVLTWFAWVRVYAALTNIDLLVQYLSHTVIVYLGFSGLVWGLAGLTSAISLYFGLPYAVWVSRCTALVCFIWYWSDYLFLAQSTITHTNLPFTLISTVLALVFAWIVPVMPKERKFLNMN
jgi:hypothetical protein